MIFVGGEGRKEKRCLSNQEKAAWKKAYRQLRKERTIVSQLVQIESNDGKHGKGQADTEQAHRGEK